MAGDQDIPQDAPAASIFDGLMPKAGSQLNTNDVSDSSQFLSPEEQAVFEQYQAQNQARPAGHGALDFQDYYPGFSNGGAVGHYSGSQVGSVSLFGGGGALVPIGMMDARDVALTKANLQKQKEVEDWKKQFKAPTSKLTNINENLTNEYFNHVKGGWNKALKKAGGDPNLAKQLLDNDPEYWKKEKSYQDLAKRGDAVVEKIADIEDRHKAGDVLSPALLEAKNKVLMDMNPDSEGFKHLSNSIIRMDADREFSDAANEALMRAVTSETGQVFDKSNPDQIKIYKKSVEQLSPETKEAVIEGLNKIYAGSSMYSPEYIRRNASGLMNYKKTKEDMNISQKREEDPGYTEKDVVPEDDYISGNVLQTTTPGKPIIDPKTKKQKVDSEGNPLFTDPTTNMREGKYKTFDRLTLRKPIKIVIPVGTKAVDLKAGGIRDKNIENSEAEIGGVYNTYTFKSFSDKNKQFDGMMMDEESYNDPKIRKQLEVTPMVSVRYKTKNEEGDDQIVSTQVPLSSLENALKGKKGENAKALEKIKSSAKEKSESMKKEHEAAAAEGKKDWSKYKR